MPVICRGCPPQLYFAESLLFLVQTRFYKMQPGPAQRLTHMQGKNKPEMQLHFEIPLFLKLFLLLQGSTSLCNTAGFSTHLHQALHLGTHPAASNPSPSFQKAFPVKNPFLFFLKKRLYGRIYIFLFDIYLIYFAPSSLRARKGWKKQLCIPSISKQVAVVNPPLLHGFARPTPAASIAFRSAKRDERRTPAPSVVKEQI